MTEEFNKKLIKLFADKTNCETQFNKCPCNTCFHSISNIDFQHISWLIILGLRGDYKDEKGMDLILNGIKEELTINQIEARLNE